MNPELPPSRNPAGPQVCERREPSRARGQASVLTVRRTPLRSLLGAATGSRTQARLRRTVVPQRRDVLWRISTSERSLLGHEPTPRTASDTAGS